MNSFTHYGQFMKFTFPEPDPKNVCNLCGGNVGKDNLIQGQAANICFDCSDLAKEMADEKRKGNTGLRRASAVLLLCHMQQRSAAFHAAGAAYPGDDI
ncbi:hypothetical protein [Proteus mirabilis]|uniref:hypothetical protein n=1 Tax=Proteus mirabilis TaxID=584 RepID=UPI001967DC11|nr:hypothetical protein [Proteus mirabilis]MBN4015998.1 hypothetical protein [Proteus mirabilis]MBN4028127.1 hypothetical protein [Proteus mirabilis]MBN4029258.1 hypothetical protein [Proteus mirabilis]QSC09341.1 hypothetical protein JW301_13355 [Proteus mirabilis]QSC13160.1 hypothetical protein JW302_13345 [Proteus mirabilis]